MIGQEKFVHRDLSPRAHKLKQRFSQLGLNPESLLISDSQKKNTAKHELRHAIAAKFNIRKVSVIPQGDSLGRTELLPMNDKDFSIAAAAGSLGDDARGYGHDFYQIRQIGAMTIESARAGARAYNEQYHPVQIDLAATFIAHMGEASKDDVIAALELAKYEINHVGKVDLNDIPKDYLKDDLEFFTSLGEDRFFATRIEYYKNRIVVVIDRDGKKSEREVCTLCKEINGHSIGCVGLKKGAIINLESLRESAA